MKVKGNTITFENTLWVQYDGVTAESKGSQVSLTRVNEDAYVKVFNHFGRVLKLFIAEEGPWVDSDTGEAVGAIDLTQAGYVEAQSVPSRKSKGASKSKPRAAKAKSGKGSGAKAAVAGGNETTGKAAAKKKTARKPAKSEKKSAAAATTKTRAATAVTKKESKAPKPRKPRNAATAAAKGRPKKDSLSTGRSK